MALSKISYFHAHETKRMLALEGLRLAAFWQRALGFCIDLVILVTLWVPLELWWTRYVSHTWDGHTRPQLMFRFHLEFSAWRELVVLVLYSVLVHYATNGRTVGKWVTRTRVISLVHERLGLWQSFERLLGYFVAIGEIIGFLQFFWSQNRMCVHDRIAETIVVDERRRSR
jgi:uncharacterized RDD family membrane protein YckC